MTFCNIERRFDGHYHPFTSPAKPPEKSPDGTKRRYRFAEPKEIAPEHESLRLGPLKAIYRVKEVFDSTRGNGNV